MEDCKGRREFEGVARLKPACLSAKHGETSRFLEFLNAFFPTPVGFLAMALPPPSPVSPPVPLHPPNLNQTDRNRSEPTGIATKAPISQFFHFFSKLCQRGQFSLYESAALGTCRASGLRCRCFGGCSLGSLYRRCCVVFARFPL